MDKDCRPFRVGKRCGATWYKRSIFMRTTLVTGQVFHVAIRRGKPCRLCGARRRCLTRSAPPVHSPRRAWWPTASSCSGRQTGNSGVIPGRPRRCVRAISEAGFATSGEKVGCLRAIACLLHKRPAGEKASNRPSLGVRRPTSVREEHVLLRGRHHGHGPRVWAAEVAVSTGGRACRAQRCPCAPTVRHDAAAGRLS